MKRRRRDRERYCLSGVPTPPPDPSDELVAEGVGRYRAWHRRMREACERAGRRRHVQLTLWPEAA